MSTRMSRMRERVMGAADDTTSALGERMESMADTVTSAPDMARSSTQGNPLAMGLVSFGVGLVAASLLPARRQERHLAQREIGRTPWREGGCQDGLITVGA